MNKRRAIIILIAVVLITGVSCSGSRAPVFKHEFLMDTIVEITVACRDRELAEKAIAGAFDEIRRIENIMGPVGGKELLELNKTAFKKSFVLSNDLFYVIDKALQYGKLTAGAFDISVAPVLELWGFLGEEKEHSVPESRPMSMALKKVDYRNIALDKKRNTVFLRNQGMKLAIGGIAKGYAVGRAMDILKENGVKNAIVNAGGDVQVAGDKFGKPWSIGIKHPRKNKILTTMPFNGDKCIFTSGDYERCFFLDGRRYHHVIDPSTGYPADSSCISVTVICNDPVAADALATSILVLGPEKGMKLIEGLPETEAVIICKTEEGIKLEQSRNIAGEYEFKY